MLNVLNNSTQSVESVEKGLKMLKALKKCLIRVGQFFHLRIKIAREYLVITNKKYPFGLRFKKTLTYVQRFKSEDLLI